MSYFAACVWGMYPKCSSSPAWHEKSGLARIAEMCIAESKYTPRAVPVCEVGDYPGFLHYREYYR